MTTPRIEQTARVLFKSHDTECAVYVLSDAFPSATTNNRGVVPVLKQFYEHVSARRPLDLTNPHSAALALMLFRSDTTSLEPMTDPRFEFEVDCREIDARSGWPSTTWRRLP